MFCSNIVTLIAWWLILVVVAVTVIVLCDDGLAIVSIFGISLLTPVSVQ